MKNISCVFFIIIFTFLNTPLHASQWDYKQYVTIDLLKGSYQKDATIGVEFNLKPGWKIYNDQEQDIGFATSFEFVNFNNVLESKVTFPQADRMFEMDRFVTYGYQDKVIFPIEFIVRDKGQDIRGDIIVKFALCKELCIPVTESIPVHLESGYTSQKNIESINQYKKGKVVILAIIFGAIMAGFILNFMPCVLPVLLLKIGFFLEKRQTDKKNIIIASFSTFCGIIFTFIILTLIVIMLKLFGYHLGWGMHFQEPLFLVFLIVILVIFAANILGYFNISMPNRLLRKVDNLGNTHNLILRHFFSGILAALLATPCSAPFLGPVISFALTTNYFNIFLVFTSIGVGLSMPYIFLIIAPKMLTILPRPGKWMKTLKEIMAVFLLITALWLLVILSRQMEIYGSIILFTELVIIFKMIKYHENIISFLGKPIFKGFFLVNIILCIFVVILFREPEYIKKPKDNWINFNDIKIEQLLKSHKGVFVNVTADWCLTCKVNEIFILNSKKLQNSFRDHDIVLVKADYTREDPNIKEYLSSFNRYAVPTYILYNENYPQGKLLSEINSSNFLIKLISEHNDETIAKEVLP